jgi:hypothetical protein
MQAFPPSGPDQAYQKRFTPLGLLDPVSPYADCPPDLARALTAGADAAKQQMETILKDGNLAPVINGWRLTFHMFDYNLDHLGPGTIDDPVWKMADRTASYLVRALAARGGLWGNHGYEAAYPMTYTDDDGSALDGRNRYTLTFDQDPPVGAFWSITMYDLPDFYLVVNPIGRYSIGDRTPGLRRDADGSLTIVIQHDQPPTPATGCPPPPRRSGRSCVCTSQSLPYWTAPMRSRPSPRWRPRPAVGGRPETPVRLGPSATLGQVHDILACLVNQPARALPLIPGTPGRPCHPQVSGTR